MTNILEAKQLSKHFGQLKAVDGVSFSVQAGETTTRSMLSGLLLRQRQR